MKREKYIPTIIAIFILLLAIAGGVILIRKGSRLFTRASQGIIPREMKITNVTDNSFSVSWITDEETIGFIQYGQGENDLSFTEVDDRDQVLGSQNSFFTHHVTLRGLNPATTYFFKINSGGRIFDNGGKSYEIKTGPVINEAPPDNDVAYGAVVGQDGSPAQGAIVYFYLAGAFPLSTITKNSGNWVIPLSLARSEDLSSWASYDKEASVEEIFVQGGPLGVSTAMAVTKYDSPLPLITLGQNFDFRQPLLTPTPTSVSSSSLPSSGFSVGNFPTAVPSLNIINPSQGETINTLTPEILGTGPGGETLEIIIESPETIRGEVVISSDGSWRWTPPTNLSPGEHKVTVSLANGQKITHSFTVLAAGDENTPSFTASPSGSLIPTPTPTSVPTPKINQTPTPTLTPTPTFLPEKTPTPIIRTSVPSTESGMPKSGNLLPTLLFIIIGGGFIMLGVINRFLGKRL